MTPIESVGAAGAPTNDNTLTVAGGGGLGNRVNAAMLATVVPAMEAALKQHLTSMGIGSQINVTI